MTSTADGGRHTTESGSPALGGPPALDRSAARRTVLTGVGAGGAAVLLAGCQVYGADSAAPPPAPPVAPTGAASGAGSPSGSGEPGVPGSDAAGGSDAGPGAGQPPDAPPPADVLAKLSDIPVGGGVVFADKGIVVTCPKEGTVKAFSTTCPHAGCAVSQVSGGTIICPCHGSKFRVADGSVAAGPATKSLSSVNVALDGDSISLT